MKLSIIETGLPPVSLRNDWPRYPAMFQTLLSASAPELDFDHVALSEGDALPDADTLDAVLITGSVAGVYDDTVWMGDLMRFILELADRRIPQIGVCFGHQAMACALGADVGQSEKGWGIGRHEYDILARPNWMTADTPDTFSLGVSHQDQVKSLPDGAVQIAASTFTPYAALDYPGIRAMSVQGHPEFSAAFSIALYNVRRGTRLSRDAVDEAEHSLRAPIDNGLVGRWMTTFLRRSRA